jgi:hypothetical protein
MKPKCYPALAALLAVTATAFAVRPSGLSPAVGNKSNSFPTANGWTVEVIATKWPTNLGHDVNVRFVPVNKGRQSSRPRAEYRLLGHRPLRDRFHPVTAELTADGNVSRRILRRRTPAGTLVPSALSVSDTPYESWSVRPAVWTGPNRFV